jgi:hypothetical protein
MRIGEFIRGSFNKLQKEQQSRTLHAVRDRGDIEPISYSKQMQAPRLRLVGNHYSFALDECAMATHLFRTKNAERTGHEAVMLSGRIKNLNPPWRNCSLLLRDLIRR